MKTILIVDDRAINLKLLRAVLDAEGYAIREAHDGVEALALLNREPVDAIISDILMPKMDGYRLCYEVRQSEKLREIPFVFYTATYTSPGDERLCLNLGADKYLRKPTSSTVLLSTLNEVLSHKVPHAPVQPSPLTEVGMMKEYSEQLVAKLEEKNIALEESNAALKEKICIASLSTDVVSAFITGKTLEEALAACTSSVVRNLGAAFARIWTLNEPNQMLELQASSGLYTHLDGPHSRVPVGKFKIGLIAQEKQPHLTNEVLNDPRVGDKEWARREGMVSFAGYPLMADNRVVGILAMFATTAQTDFVLKALSTIANTIALGITRKWAEANAVKLETQLRQTMKMEAIGQLAGGIAHDFNNLLTVINGRSQLMMMRLKAGDRMRDELDLIFKTGERAASLTRQLLAFSRQQVLEPKVIDINKVAMDMDKMLQRLIREDISLATILSPAVKPILADPAQIEQIIMNLVVNARDAMPKGGTLTIETSNVELNDAYCQTHSGVIAGNYVLLAVTDTGTGMTEAVKARIFEPFFTTKEVGTGTGLGLSTVYGIAKQSHGHIEVYSEVGKGSSFKVYLPYAEVEATSARSGGAFQKVPTGHETILLVEDEQGVRELVRDLLEMSGYKVLVARHGGDALQISAEYKDSIHLLISDVVMPEIGGVELSERIGKMRPDMKVLFASGYPDNAIVRNGVLTPGVAFLQKPFTPAALTRKVREILDK